MAIREEHRRAALAFIRANPWIWEAFCDLTLAMIESGRKHYAARAVFDRLRWHIEERMLLIGRRPVSLCNNYHPTFARQFHEQYPEHDGFFITRGDDDDDSPRRPSPQMSLGL